MISVRTASNSAMITTGYIKNKSLEHNHYIIVFSMDGPIPVLTFYNCIIKNNNNFQHKYKEG
jgi:hypothetical protein